MAEGPPVLAGGSVLRAASAASWANDSSRTGAWCGHLPPRMGPKLAGQPNSAARAQRDMGLAPSGTQLGQGEEGGTC